MYNLFLDDIRMPSDVLWVQLPLVKWQIVRNYDSFVDIIKNRGIPKFVSYDHDLSEEHYHSDSLYFENIYYSNYKNKTGYDCAKYLVDVCIKSEIKHPSYIVHSLNPVGKQNIISYINSYNKLKNIK